MTNATVSWVATATGGQVLKVSFKGGESEFIVGPDVPAGRGGITYGRSRLQPTWAVPLPPSGQNAGSARRGAAGRARRSWQAGSCDGASG